VREAAENTCIYKLTIFLSQISWKNAAGHPIYLAAFSVRQIGQLASAIFPLNEYNHLTLKLFGVASAGDEGCLCVYARTYI
jgi:hypothetical protein